MTRCDCVSSALERFLFFASIPRSGRRNSYANGGGDSQPVTARTLPMGLDGPWTNCERNNARILSPVHYAAKHLTVIPPASLFDFSFSLCDSGRLVAGLRIGNNDASPLVRFIPGGEFLGKLTRLAIAPSGAWLKYARQNSKQTNPRWKAWLGSPRARDPAIVALHKYVAPSCSEVRNVEVIEGDQPDGMVDSAVAIIGSHGRREATGTFHAISDGRTSFSASEIADNLASCGCVVALCLPEAGVAWQLIHQRNARYGSRLIEQWG